MSIMYRLELKRNRVNLKEDSLIMIKQDIFVKEIYYLSDIEVCPGIIVGFNRDCHKKLSI